MWSALHTMSELNKFSADVIPGCLCSVLEPSKASGICANTTYVNAYLFNILEVTHATASTNELSGPRGKLMPHCLFHDPTASGFTHQPQLALAPSPRWLGGGGGKSQTRRQTSRPPSIRMWSRDSCACLAPATSVCLLTYH